jgi:hypothetical protein
LRWIAQAQQPSQQHFKEGALLLKAIGSCIGTSVCKSRIRRQARRRQALKMKSFEITSITLSARDFPFLVAIQMSVASFDGFGPHQNHRSPKKSPPASLKLFH